MFIIREIRSCAMRCKYLLFSCVICLSFTCGIHLSVRRLFLLNLVVLLWLLNVVLERPFQVQGYKGILSCAFHVLYSYIGVI